MLERFGWQKEDRALPVLIGCEATLLDVDQCESFKASIPATEGTYLLNSVGYKPQVGHNDMSLKTSSPPG